MVGIDPGQTGALVAIDQAGRIVEVMDMPIRRFENSKAKYLNGFLIGEFFERNEPSHVFVEQVSSRPGQGIASSFQFGMHYGAIVSLALIHSPDRPRAVLVAPAVWKRHFGLIGREKDAARKLILVKYRPCDNLFKLKKHGGRADAYLIARYGLSTLLGKEKYTKKLH